MESKSKKTTTKSEEIVIKNQIDYTTILNRIFICLLIIIVITAINLCINIAVNTKSNKTTTNDTETLENTDYDVSSFKTMTTTEVVKSIDKGDTQVIYIGRSTCGYCVKFIPILKQAQEDLGYTTTYINLEEVTTDDQAKLVAYNTYISENFGYTPMVLVFKDGKYVDGWVGYAELETFEAFLKDAGIK